MVYSWQDRTSKKRKRNRLLLLIIVIVVVTLPLFVGSAGLIRITKLKREKRILQKQILILKAEKEVIDQRIERYLHDNELIERKARDELKMIKDGEKVYQLQPVKKL